jgi:hypothetical protein
MTASNLWVYTNETNWVPYTNVSCVRSTWRQSYNWNDEPQVTAGGADTSGSTVGPQLKSVPVHLTATTLNTAAAFSVSPVVPDSWLHLPPRYGFRAVDGYILALPGAVLPTATDTWPVPRWASTVVTIDLTTNVLTSTGNHLLESGDIIALSTTGALPTGVVTTDLLTVEKMSATTYRVLKAGAPVDFSGTQSGTHSAVLVTSILPVPMLSPAESGLLYLPDDRGTLITNSNPYVR